METNTKPDAVDTSSVTPTPEVKENVTNTPPAPVAVAPKKGKKKGCIIAVIIAMLLACCVVIAAIVSIINIYHIPAISVVTEDVFLSPGQQLNKRLDLYSDILVDSAKSKDGGLSFMQQSQLNQAEKALGKLDKMSMDMEMSMTIDNSTLDTEATKMDATLHFDIDGSDAKNQVMSGDIDMMADLLDAQIGLNFVATSDTAYFMLKDDSTYPDVDLTSLSNTWYDIPITDAGGLAAAYQLEDTDTLEEADSEVMTDEMLADIENIQKILDHKTIIDNTTTFAGDDVNGQATKCYKVSLNNAQIIEVAKYASEVLDEKYDATIYESITKSDVTICFGKDDSVPYSAAWKVTMEEDTTVTTLDMSISYYPNPDVNIKVPTDSTNYMEMDLSDVLVENENTIDDSEYDTTDIIDSTDDFELSSYKTCTFAPESAGCASCELFGETEDTCAYCEEMYTTFSYITTPEDRFNDYCTDLATY